MAAQMFLFHCKWSIFNTQNIITSVYLSFKELFNSSQFNLTIYGKTKKPSIIHHPWRVCFKQTYCKIRRLREKLRL